MPVKQTENRYERKRTSEGDTDRTSSRSYHVRGSETLCSLFPSSPPLLFPCIPLGNNKHLLHKAVLISEIADAMTEEFGHTKQDGGKSEAKQSLVVNE